MSAFSCKQRRIAPLDNTSTLSEMLISKTLLIEPRQLAQGTTTTITTGISLIIVETTTTAAAETTITSTTNHLSENASHSIFYFTTQDTHILP